MSGGEALDLALGLLRAPARRMLLVARPLPTGMTSLLEVASGSAAAANKAAASTGADPAELLEAARFFVQQVLLADGADAYRNMGVDRHADIGRIREHHRLLLRWLHPDRSGSEQWDSVLATRVNQAWNQLRTPAARAGYDSRLPAEQTADASPPAHVRSVAPPPAGARADPGAAPGRRFAPGALGVAAVAIACIGLGWLAYQGVREPVTPDFHRVQGPVPASALGPETGPDPDLGAVAAIAAAAGSAPAVTRDDEPEALAPESPKPAILVKPQPEASAKTPQMLAVTEVSAAPPVASLVSPEASPEASSPDFSSPAQSPGIVAPIAIDAIPQSAPDFPAASSVTPPPGTITTTDFAVASDPLQRFESANSAIDALADWLASSDDTHQPDYARPSARLDAVDTRLRLYDRLGQGPAGHLALEDRDWRLGEQRATMDARYRLTLRGRERETGIAHIELARQESRWKLAALSLVADP